MKLATTSGFLLFFSMLLTLSGCHETSSDPVFSSGKPGEILIVADKSMWESPGTHTIRSYFSRPFPGLPQPEPRFVVIHVPPASFNGLLQSHHAILRIENGKDDPAGWHVRHNVWSQPQVIITLQATDDTSVPSLSEASLRRIGDMFDSIRVARDQHFLRQNPNDTLIKLVREKFAIYIPIPGGYSLAKESKDFIWCRKETRETGLGIIIYKTACRDTNLFSQAFLLASRDTILHRHIPGPAEGSFMSTHISLQPPIFRDFMHHGQKVTEIRGLWETKGDFMGGPFISYAIFNPDSLTILTMEGYVYAPGQRKAPFIRELEAMLNGVIRNL